MADPEELMKMKGPDWGISPDEAEIEDLHEALVLLQEEIEQLKKEVNLLEVSRREIIEIDEERCGEIERLRAGLKSAIDLILDMERGMQPLRADFEKIASLLNCGQTNT